MTQGTESVGSDFGGKRTEDLRESRHLVETSHLMTSQLPGILMALIEDVLHNNKSLELHSTDIDAVVMSYVHPSNYT